MISQKLTAFKLNDRGKPRTIILIPGWASDSRIFASLDLEFNYLIPDTIFPETFEESLLAALKENDIKTVSLFGWSLGGFLASEFASRHKDLVENLFFVGVRKKYKKEEVEKVKSLLRKNKKAYLYKFYTQCFTKAEDMAWFKKTLLKDYCENLDADYLIYTLDYLQNREVDSSSLKGVQNIKILHGTADRIAPIEEARNLKCSIGHAEFISIENTGHMPFLKNNFKELL